MYARTAGGNLGDPSLQYPGYYPPGIGAAMMQAMRCVNPGVPSYALTPDAAPPLAGFPGCGPQGMQNFAPGCCPTPASFTPWGRRFGARRTIQGFPTTVIGAGATVNVAVQVLEPFIGQRFGIPSDISPALLVNQITVGTMPQLNGSPIPARAFDQTSQDSGLIDFDYCPVSQQIIVNVTNTSAAPVSFNAWIEGVTVG